MVIMIERIRNYVFAWRYLRAVRQARNLAGLFGMRYYVISLNDKLKVVPKQTVKELIRRKRFRKGVIVVDIEKAALFVTN